MRGRDKGPFEEIARSTRQNKKDYVEGGSDNPLKTVIVPSANISTDPISWINPVRHEKTAAYLSEIVYSTSVETGMMYNVRNVLGLGSSDHASVEQVSKRGKAELGQVC